MKIRDLESELGKNRKQLLNTKPQKCKMESLNDTEILYSICSEFFIERMNFKNIMFSKHLREIEQYGSFAPNAYFTNEFEFGAH